MPEKQYGNAEHANHSNQTPQENGKKKPPYKGGFNLFVSERACCEKSVYDNK